MRCVCLGIVAFWSYQANAAEAAATVDEVSHNLPDLPGADDAAPGHFSLDEQSAALSYDTRQRKWGAKLDEYLDINRSFTLDYGMLLTNKLGAGASLTHQSSYSEVLVNGVYAPKRNLRVQLTGGQLRTSTDSALSSASNSVLQNSYMLDVRRNWAKSKLLSDIGVTAYVIEANGPDYTDISAMTNASMLDASEPAVGRMNGYMLNFGLRPTLRSKIELRREISHLTYYFDDANRSNEQLVSNQIEYSKYFDDCTRFQGGYSTSATYDRVDLNIARNSWNINLSRALHSDSSDTSVQIGYAIPLGRSQDGPRDCGSNSEGMLAFEPIVDATIGRPDQFPREALTRIDTTLTTDPVAE